MDRIPEAFADLRRWVTAGETAYRVDVQEGLGHVPRTFLRHPVPSRIRFALISEGFEHVPRTFLACSPVPTRERLLRL